MKDLDSGLKELRTAVSFGADPEQLCEALIDRFGQNKANAVALLALCRPACDRRQLPLQVHGRSMRTLLNIDSLGQRLDHQKAAPTEARIERRLPPPAVVPDSDHHASVGGADRYQIDRALAGGICVLGGIGQRLVAGKHEIGHRQGQQADRGGPVLQLVTHLNQWARLSDDARANQRRNSRIDYNSGPQDLD